MVVRNFCYVLGVVPNPSPGGFPVIDTFSGIGESAETHALPSDYLEA